MNFFKRLRGRRDAGEPERVVGEIPFPEDLQRLALQSNRLGLFRIPSHPCTDQKAVVDVNFDIVAIHGLGGDFCKTWTRKADSSTGSDFLWLSQLLPVDLPESRVYSFGYDSKPAFSKSVASIRAAADRLLALLLSESQEGRSRRPIIFICHSLGGIVVKQAMVIASQDERYTEIYQAAKAIMFMGTPHKGSAIASFIIPFVDVLNFGLKYSGGSLITGGMRRDLIKLLRDGSKSLDELNKQFLPCASGMLLISCYETMWPAIANQPIVSEDSAVFGRDTNHFRVPIEADHMAMCRFSSLTDETYQLVRNTFLYIVKRIAKGLQNEALEAIHTRRSSTESDRRYRSYFHQDFQPIPQSQRVEGTCRWLFDTVEYQQWQGNDKPTLLWLTGNAGCGKTTLMSFVSETVQQVNGKDDTDESGPLGLTFFCSRDNTARDNGEAVIHGLIRSLLTVWPHVARPLKAEFGPIKRDFRQPLEFWWRVLMTALDHVPNELCYIIVDGLDECQEFSRKQLLVCVVEMMKLYHAKAKPGSKRLKVLFASQPQTWTEFKASGSASDLLRLSIEDRPEMLSQDILKVIDHDVDNLVQLRRCSASFAAKLRLTLPERAQNSFLWVSLVLSQMKTTIALDGVELQQLLDQLPGDLSEAYARYLPTSGPQNAPIIAQYVRLLVACRRSLTLAEIGAFTNPNLHSSASVTEEQLSVLQNNLELTFGPLIRLTGTQVDFIHSTVKGFLSHVGDEDSHTTRKTLSTDAKTANLALAGACVNYLLSPDLHFDSFGNAEPAVFQPDDGFVITDQFDIQDFAFIVDEEAINDGPCSNLRKSFAAFDYAAKYWTQHFASSEDIASDALKEAARSLLNPNSIHASNWYRYMIYETRNRLPKFERIDEILLTAMFGFSDALRITISQYKNRDGDLNVRCQTALFWAASQGHVGTVQILLDHGINPNFLEHGQSPLTVAICGGHLDVVLRLLQAPQIDPNLPDKDTQSPLLNAFEFHQHEMARALLAHPGLQVNLANKFGFTPLLCAASSGCVACLRTLMSDDRIDFTACDRKGRNALSYAACTESLDAINLVIRRLTADDIQKRDSSGRNAISYAAERSCLDTVKRLRELNIPISGDNQGRNATSWAVSRPSPVVQKDRENTVLRFLVKEDPPSADMEDSAGWTPLFWAMDGSGDLVSVKILVEFGRVDINRRDRTGWLARTWAVGAGLKEIAQYLLQVPRV